MKIPQDHYNRNLQLVCLSDINFAKSIRHLIPILYNRSKNYFYISNLHIQLIVIIENEPFVQ